MIVDVPLGARLLWASDRKLVRRALTCLGTAGVTCVMGERTVAREGRAVFCYAAYDAARRSYIKIM